MVGLHPWALGCSAATTLSSLPQQLSFLFIGSSATTSSSHCCGVGISQFFSIPPTCCRRWGWQLPSLGCSGCCSYRDRSGPGLGCGTDLLSDPEPSFESTFHLACTVLLMLHVMNMGLTIQPLVLDGTAILIAFQECAIGREDQA